jgi:hypothetical protein
MSLHLILACVAVVAAIVLVQHRPLTFPIIALCVAGVEALMALHVLNLHIPRLPLDFVFGGALVVCGAAVYARTNSKSIVAAATALTMIGALQVLAGLHIR